MITLFERGDTLAAVNNDACPFMAEDGGKQPFRIGSGQGEFVGMTNARGLDFDQDLTVFRTFQLNRFDR